MKFDITNLAIIVSVTTISCIGMFLLGIDSKDITIAAVGGLVGYLGGVATK